MTVVVADLAFVVAAVLLFCSLRRLDRRRLKGRLQIGSDRGMAIASRFGRADLAPGLSGRGLQAKVGPRLQITHRVNHSTPNLPIGWSCSEGAMLLQGSPGEAQKTACFRRPQKAGPYGKVG